MTRSKPVARQGRRTVTIRTSLIVAMVLLVLLISIGTMVGTIIISRGRVLSISSSLVSNATENIASEMKAFFRPVPGALVLVDRFAQQDGFNVTDTFHLNKVFMPMVSSLPMVNSANIGDGQNNSYILLGNGDEWLTRETRPSEWGAQVKVRRWRDENTVVEEWFEDQEYDVRTQPWYTMVMERKQAGGELKSVDSVAGAKPEDLKKPVAKASRNDLPDIDKLDGKRPVSNRKKPKSTNRDERPLVEQKPQRDGDSGVEKPRQAADPEMANSIAERRQVCWTEPYLLGETKVPAITGARMIQCGDGESFVAAFDLLLTDITQFTQRLEPSENGIAWVMTTDSKMIGLPRQVKIQIRKAVPEDILKGVDELDLTSITQALAVWRSRMERGDDMLKPQRALIGDKPCWISMTPFNLSDSRSLNIVVMLPESDFFNPDAQRKFIFGIAIVALAFAVAISVFLSGWYSEPLRSLVVQSERLQRLDLEQNELVATSLHEVKQLTDSHDNMRKALGSFAHYVPTQLVRDLLERGEAAAIGVKERNLTVMFSDIAGFTSIAEKIESDQLTEQIAEHFGAGLHALQNGGGTIDKLMGDGVMAFWGAPKPDDDHNRNAVIAVLECAKRLEEINRQWQEKGWPRFETRIGLASGDVLVGNIGTYSRFDYTVVGDTVNLASRLEGINKLYGTQILVSEQTKLGAGAGFVWRMVDKVNVKGKEIPVQIFELLGYKGEIDSQRLEFIAQYEKALKLYWERRFNEASKVLNVLQAPYTNDLSVARLAGQCSECESQPPPDDWNSSTEANI